MEQTPRFAFSRINFILLGVAVALILIGYLLMSGSGSTDTFFNPEIFSATRIVVAPAVCFVGYVFIIVAILYPSKPHQDLSDASSSSEVEA